MFGIKRKTKRKLKERLLVIIKREEEIASMARQLDDLSAQRIKISQDREYNIRERRSLREWENRLHTYKNDVIDSYTERKDKEVADLNATIEELNSKVEDLVKENNVMLNEKLEYLTALKRLGAEIKIR